MKTLTTALFLSLIASVTLPGCQEYNYMEQKPDYNRDIVETQDVPILHDSTDIQNDIERDIRDVHNADIVDSVSCNLGIYIDERFTQCYDLCITDLILYCDNGHFIIAENQSYYCTDFCITSLDCLLEEREVYGIASLVGENYEISCASNGFRQDENINNENRPVPGTGPGYR